MLRFVLEGLVYCKEDIEEYLNKASEKFKEVLDFATEIKKILVEKGIPNKDYIDEALLSTYYLMLTKEMVKKYGFKTTLNALYDFIDAVLNPQEFLKDLTKTYEELKKIEEEVGLDESDN